jgi:hypothetical protein
MMGDERAGLTARLAYCQATLLPIWERRTDGDPALRRLLEGPTAGPDNHEERLRALRLTSADLRRRGERGPGVAAAILAAWACLKAYLEVPEGEWQRAVQRALVADRATGALGVPLRTAPSRAPATAGES